VHEYKFCRANGGLYADLLLAIDSDRDLWALINDAGYMSCAKLVSYDCLDSLHKGLRERGTLNHFYEKNDDLVCIKFASSPNTESIFDVWEMLHDHIIYLRTAESDACRL